MSGIIILKRRFIDVEMPRARVTMKGRYKLKKFNQNCPEGIYLAESAWSDNIILNSGLDRLGSGQGVLGCAIGTGTSTPAATDTGLQTQTTYTTTAGTGNGGLASAGASNYNNTRTHVFRTTLGALNGSYTEVGAGWASGSNMFSRALILDGGGTPTSFPVASDEQVDIVYEFSVYPPLTDFIDTVTISGVSYDVTGRACNVNSTSSFGWSASTAQIVLDTGMSNNASVWNNVIGAITAANPTGTSATGSLTFSNATYSSSSYTREGSITHGTASGNLAGSIKSTRVVWGSDAFTFQYEWDPVIPKDSTKTLVLNYGVTWARR
jgi:hypothetical protein